MRRGFTLVEILVVLAILGITAAAVVPALARATEEDDVTTTARAVERILVAARTAALEEATHVDVTFAPAQGTYWARMRDGATLDSGTLALAGKSRLQSFVDRPRFQFGPAGTVDGDSLVVLGSAGARALVIDRWTGAIRVEPR